MTATAAPATSGRKWWIVAAMTLPLMILTIDFFGITVALPSIGRDLNTNTASLEWVINGFMLAFAAPLIAFGRLGDIYGRRMVLLAGLAIFAIASMLAGVAQEAWWLIAARVTQGLGTSMFFVTSLSIVSNAFPPSQRGLGIGVWTAAGAVGQSIGPLVGGFLSEGLSWRWFFFVNVPIAVVAMIMTVLVVEETRDETAPRAIDIRGLAALTAGLVLVVFGIQSSGGEGWRSPLVLGPIGLGVALLALFVLIEPRIRNPLIEFALFRSRNFVGAVAVAFLGNWVFGAVIFFMTLYLQHVRDLSPVRAGATILMFSVPFAALSPVAGKAMGPLGVRWSLLLGMVLSGISSVLFALIDTGTGIAQILAGLFIFAVGAAFAYNVSTAAAMLAIPEAKAGAASGVQNTIRQFGIIFGVAVSGALFKALENAKLLSLFDSTGAGLSAGDRDEVRNLLSGSDAAQAELATLTPATAEQIGEIVDRAFIHGLSGAMWLCVAVSVLGMALSFIVQARVRAAATAAPAPART